MKKKIFIFLVSFVFLCIFSIGIVNAEEKEVLTETQKELIKNTVFVHNVSINKEHIVIDNFESSLSPIIFMATWIFDIDSFRVYSLNSNYAYFDLYNPDKTKKPTTIRIMIFRMIQKEGPKKGQRVTILLSYVYKLDGINYIYALKNGKYVRYKGQNQTKI